MTADAETCDPSVHQKKGKAEDEDENENEDEDEGCRRDSAPTTASNRMNSKAPKGVKAFSRPLGPLTGGGVSPRYAVIYAIDP